MRYSETPVKLLNCRVSSKWNSLPTYAAVNPGSTGQASGGCSLHGHTGPPITGAPSRSAFLPPQESITPPIRTSGLPPFVSTSRENSYSRERNPYEIGGERRASDLPPIVPSTTNGLGASGAEHEDTLLERNIVFDRLMSGQETETGEIPPSYGEAVASAIRSASRSQSRVRTGRSRLGSEVTGPGGVEMREERGSSTGRSRSRVD